MVRKFLEEFFPDRGRDSVVFLEVEMLVNAQHDISDEWALRVGAGKRDVSFESFIEFARLLVALSEFVL